MSLLLCICSGANERNAKENQITKFKTIHAVHSGQAADVSTTSWLHQQTGSFTNSHPSVLPREKPQKFLAFSASSTQCLFLFDLV